MADISQYSIVTYERRPGHWRAAITPIRRSGTLIQGKTISSIVTPDDSASEPDAKFAAERIYQETVDLLLMSFFIADHHRALECLIGKSFRTQLG